MENNSLMSKILTYIGVTALIFIIVTGGLMNHSESIPDNAKIFVIEEYETWVPNVGWVEEIFRKQAADDINAAKSYDEKIATTYMEVKKGGRYEGFELPESWQSDKNEIVWGRNQSLLMSWVFPEENRWNEDGSWNW